jgi:hypothetical protein
MNKDSGFRIMKEKLGSFGMLSKKCMGVSSDPTMVFDLHSLITVVPDLENLALPFQHNEMITLLKECRLTRPQALTASTVCS